MSRLASAAGSGTGMPCCRQVLHQVQVEGQLLEAQALEQRQHELAARRWSTK
jgi:hypothetical protein